MHGSPLVCQQNIERVQYQPSYTTANVIDTFLPIHYTFSIKPATLYYNQCHTHSPTDWLHVLHRPNYATTTSQTHFYR